MKKVLIIAYHFPPDSAVGSVRPAKFAKYLPEFGWEPIVFTVNEKYYESCDYSRFESALKSLKIYRANLIPGPLNLYSRFLHKGGTPINKMSGAPRLPAQSIQNGTSYLKRLLSSTIRLPDDKQGWILNILISGYRIIKHHNIDVFITSGPPESTHLGGLLLKSITRAKWIADFRDSWWPVLQRDDLRYRTPFSDALHRILESRVMLNADLLVSVAPTITEYFRSHLPLNQSGKCVTITNGFDESDFAVSNHTGLNNDSRIRILYAGNLYFSRNPEPFLFALKTLTLRGKIRKEQILIEFIGDCGNYDGTSVSDLIEKFGLSGMVQLKNRIPYHDCIQQMMSSHALLLFAQGLPEQLTTKLFEYLRINKPIFAIVDEGDAKTILQSFQHAFIANPNSTDDIAEKFLQMLEAIRNNKLLLASAEQIERYDRRNLTEMLAQSLNNL